MTIPPDRAVGRARRAPSVDGDAAGVEPTPWELPPLSPDQLAAARAIGRVFEAARDVVLTTHVNPDGDGLGSQAALAAHLSNRGVRARILNPDPAPRRFRFLATERVPLGVFRGFEEDALGLTDVVVILDTGVTGRLGALAEALGRSPATLVCVDHHPQTGPLPAVSLVDPRASSTAELVYRLLRELGAEVAPDIALPLYVGIAFDTGSFRYANTRPETHLVAADLLRRGVNPAEIYARMFATHSAGRMRLWGRALSSLALGFGGRLAWVAIDRGLLAETGATPEDLEGLVEQGRQIMGVDLSILLRETAPAEVKVSFRSNGAVDVNALAGRLGGGGHVNAAGATLRLSLPDAVRRVLAEAETALAGLHDGAPPASATPPRGEQRPESEGH